MKERDYLAEEIIEKSEKLQKAKFWKGFMCGVVCSFLLITLI